MYYGGFDCKMDVINRIMRNKRKIVSFFVIFLLLDLCVYPVFASDCGRVKSVTEGDILIQYCSNNPLKQTEGGSEYKGYFIYAYVPKGEAVLKIEKGPPVSKVESLDESVSVGWDEESKEITIKNSGMYVLLSKDSGNLIFSFDKDKVSVYSTEKCEELVDHKTRLLMELFRQTYLIEFLERSLIVGAAVTSSILLYLPAFKSMAKIDYEIFRRARPQLVKNLGELSWNEMNENHISIFETIDEKGVRGVIEKLKKGGDLEKGAKREIFAVLLASFEEGERFVSIDQKFTYIIDGRRIEGETDVLTIDSEGRYHYYECGSHSIDELKKKVERAKGKYGKNMKFTYVTPKKIPEGHELRKWLTDNGYEVIDDVENKKIIGGGLLVVTITERIYWEEALDLMKELNEKINRKNSNIDENKMNKILESLKKKRENVVMIDHILHAEKLNIMLNCEKNIREIINLIKANKFNKARELFEKTHNLLNEGQTLYRTGASVILSNLHKLYKKYNRWIPEEFKRKIMAQRRILGECFETYIKTGKIVRFKWFNTAEGKAWRKITEALGWEKIPDPLIRGRMSLYDKMKLVAIKFGLEEPEIFSGAILLIAQVLGPIAVEELERSGDPDFIFAGVLLETIIDISTIVSSVFLGYSLHMAFVTGTFGLVIGQLAIEFILFVIAGFLVYWTWDWLFHEGPIVFIANIQTDNGLCTVQGKWNGQQKIICHPSE